MVTIDPTVARINDYVKKTVCSATEKNIGENEGLLDTKAIERSLTQQVTSGVIRDFKIEGCRQKGDVVEVSFLFTPTYPYSSIRTSFTVDGTVLDKRYKGMTKEQIIEAKFVEYLENKPW